MWLAILALGSALAADMAHYDLEERYTHGEFDQGMAEAKAAIVAHPEDADLYWHVVRFYYELGEQVQKDQATFDKDQFYSEMLDYADRGLAVAPDHPHLLFGRGIALGRLGTTRGILASLRWADDIEHDWQAAMDSDYSYTSIGGEEILPCDATMGLGTFYRMVPDWWIVKVLSGTRGDLDKSVDLLEKANACSPGRIEHMKELAVARMCMGDRRKEPEQVEKGLAILRQVETMPPKKPTDFVDLRHVKMLIADPGMACEYSRDGQADLDEAKVKR